KPYCVSVLAFSNAVHNFWRDSMKAMLGNALIVLKEYQKEVAPHPTRAVEAIMGMRKGTKRVVRRRNLRDALFMS
ncbi:MAG: hypothetical protein LH649_14630, partial [Pseudanabaena sp. CAN_BIN31]|nr:hypothetical protein [Pseudanabaena sp. CAN_BIN31]